MTGRRWNTAVHPALRLDASRRGDGLGQPSTREGAVRGAVSRGYDVERLREQCGELFKAEAEDFFFVSPQLWDDQQVRR